MNKFSAINDLNQHGINIKTLKKEQVIQYQLKRFGGKDFNPPLLFKAVLVLAKPFQYSRNSWAVQVKNFEQDPRLKDTHIMYRAEQAVDVEDIVKIGF